MPDKRPVFLLAGGRGRVRIVPDPLIQAVYKECGIPSPTIAYVGTANDDSPDFYNRMADYFKENGASKVTHALIRPPRAGIAKAKDILQSADIVFISGGDVEYGMKVLKEKKMTDFLSALYAEGKPFFGVSAGSIMLGKEWVRWPESDNSDSAELFTCLCIAPVICDTHGEEDDFEELQAALQLKMDGTEGYGIVTGTAIKVYPDGTVEAVGGNSYRYVHRGNKVERIADLVPLK